MEYRTPFRTTDSWKEDWEKTKTLPEGMDLYHGTGSEFGGEDLIMPAWFSNSQEAAAWFARRSGGKDAAVLAFTTTEEIDLPVVSGLEDGFQELAERFDIEYLSDRKKFETVGSAALPGWIVPNLYSDVDGDNIFLDKTDQVRFLERVEVG